MPPGTAQRAVLHRRGWRCATSSACSLHWRARGRVPAPPPPPPSAAAAVHGLLCTSLHKTHPHHAPHPLHPSRVRVRCVCAVPPTLSKSRKSRFLFFSPRFSAELQALKNGPLPLRPASGLCVPRGYAAARAAVAQRAHARARCRTATWAYAAPRLGCPWRRRRGGGRWGRGEPQTDAKGHARTHRRRFPSHSGRNAADQRQTSGRIHGIPLLHDTYWAISVHVCPPATPRCMHAPCRWMLRY